MPNFTGTVIPFNPKAAADLQAAAHQLDELCYHSGRLSVDLQWSAIEWRAACSPVLSRMSRARQSLAALDSIRVGRHADTRWAAQIRSAHRDVERRLTDIRISMSAVTSMEVTTPDAVAAVSYDAMLLAAALSHLGTLIAERYPALAGDKTGW